MFLTAQEVAALADAINPHYRVAVFVAAYTGLRAGELWALRRRDFDRLHGALRVERALKDDSGKLVFGPTKTHAKRAQRLPRFLGDMLESHVASLPGGTPDALLFSSVRGAIQQQRLFNTRYFKPAVARLVGAGALPPEKAGLRWHDLRHTATAFLIAAGAPRSCSSAWATRRSP